MPIIIMALQTANSFDCFSCMSQVDKASNTLPAPITIDPSSGSIAPIINPAIPAKYGIRNIPTILFFKGGEVADKQVGAVPKTVLAQKIDALL